jgi:hypothetical protein
MKAERRCITMFKRLKQKINNYILYTSIPFIILIAVVSFIIVGHNLYENFKDTAHENIVQSIKNSSFNIESAKNATIQISKNNDIINTLNKNEYNPQINPILNMVKNTSFSIAGVTLYTTGNQVYSTNNISGYPTLEELKTNPEINNFINSNHDYFLSIRTSQIAGFYNHVKYDQDYGMITHIVKLYDQNDALRGYLFVDIKPDYIYNNFFSYSNYQNYKNIETFIITPEDTYLKSDRNSAENVKYLNLKHTGETTKISKDKKYLIITKEYLNNSSIITLIPMKPYYLSLVKIGSILLISSIILIIIAKLIAAKLDSYITTPLSQLLKKMNKTDTNIKEKT